MVLLLFGGFFSDADVERLRAGTLEVCKDAPSCGQELTGLDALAWLAVDERVLRIARAVLGDTLVYYGETQVQDTTDQNELGVDAFRALHRDAIGNRENLFKKYKPSFPELASPY